MKNNKDSSDTDEVVEYSPLLHQVAGCHSGVPSKILVNKKGHILKPYKPFSNPTFTNDPKEIEEMKSKDLMPVTLNELEFYRRLEQSKEKDEIALNRLSPNFYGSIKIGEIDHLILEDFTYGMKYPCVMDIKVGKERYYPGRAKEKAKQDNIKYPCLQEFGFCLAGIKLWNAETGEIDFHYMPKTTRGFSSQKAKEEIAKFMRADKCKSIKEQVVKQVEAINQWSLEQRSLILRGSSLLFVYDAADVPSDQAKARVGMIDFAHIFYSWGTKDENYVKGMTNLVDYLSSL